MGEHPEITRTGTKAFSEGVGENASLQLWLTLLHGSHCLQPYWVCTRGC